MNQENNINKMAEIDALEAEHSAMVTKDQACFMNGEEAHYNETDYLDLAVAFRTVAGEEIDMS